MGRGAVKTTNRELNSNINSNNQAEKSSVVSVSDRKDDLSFEEVAFAAPNHIAINWASFNRNTTSFVQTDVTSSLSWVPSRTVDGQQYDVDTFEIDYGVVPVDLNADGQYLFTFAGLLGDDMGILDVTVDGLSLTSVDYYAPFPVGTDILKTAIVTNLTGGLHEVGLSCTTRNAGSSDFVLRMINDGMRVSNYLPLIPFVKTSASPIAPSKDVKIKNQPSFTIHPIDISQISSMVSKALRNLIEQVMEDMRFVYNFKIDSLLDISRVTQSHEMNLIAFKAIQLRISQLELTPLPRTDLDNLKHEAAKMKRVMQDGNLQISIQCVAASSRINQLVSCVRNFESLI